MFKYKIIVKTYGSHSILIEWPQQIDEHILDDIISFSQHLEVVLSDKLIDYTPAYASILIRYHETVDFEVEKLIIESAYAECPDHASKGRRWEIPVCYHNSLGLDQLAFEQIGIGHNELVTLHTTRNYRVYMLGFLPGFLYLGGLDERLHLPRKSAPSMKTPARSVAIGGNQTGIYPIQSPGGWHVIGRTPLDLFDIDSTPPTPIQQGDYIKFYPIALQEYEALMRR